LHYSVAVHSLLKGNLERGGKKKGEVYITRRERKLGKENH